MASEELLGCEATVETGSTDPTTTDVTGGGSQTSETLQADSSTVSNTTETSSDNTLSTNITLVTADSSEDAALANLISADGRTLDQRLNQGLGAVWEQLSSSAADSAGFHALLSDVFGATATDNEAFLTAASALTAALASGDRLGLRFELETGAEMGNAAGAYALVGDDGVPTIYINGDWLAGASDELLQRVLLEEIGHSFDPVLNGSTDTAGDEGELFANLFTGTLLSDEQRAAISAENDQTTLTIDGQTVLVEEATTAGGGTFTEATDTGSGTYSGNVVSLFTSNNTTGGASNFTGSGTTSDSIKIVISNWAAGDRLVLSTSAQTNITSTTVGNGEQGSRYTIAIDGSGGSNSFSGWTGFTNISSISGTISYSGTNNEIATITISYTVGGANTTAYTNNSRAFKDIVANSLAFYSVSDNPTNVGGAYSATTRTVDLYNTSAATAVVTNGSATVTVTPTNDAPILAAANFSPALDTVLTNTGGPVNGSTTGQLVSSLIGGVNQIVDPDSTARGIAITAVNTAAGTLYYSTNGGSTWTAVGAVSETSALLLSSTDRLYLASTSTAGSTTDALTFKAWDQSAETAASKVDTTVVGSTAFSTSTDTVSVLISSPAAVNNAPTLADTSVTLTTVLTSTGAPTDGSTIASTLVSDLVAGITDTQTASQSGSPTTGIAITALNAVSLAGGGTALGTLWYSLNNGGSWTQVTGLTGSNGLLLLADSNTRLYYQPPAGVAAGSGSPFTFRAWDATSGTAGTLVSIPAYTADGAFSSATDTADLQLIAGTSVNFSENGAAVDPLGTTYTQTNFSNQPGANLVITVTDVVAGDQLTLGNGTGTASTVTLNNSLASTQLGAIGSYSVVYNSTTRVATITLTGLSATNKAVVANGVTYINSRDDLSNSSRIITLLDNSNTIGAGQVFVAAVNDAPVLADTSLSYPAITSGNAAPVNGQSVGQLVSSLTGGITDPDSASSLPKGIAITSVASGFTLYYTTNGGITWNAAPNPIPTGNALLLADNANTRIYLQGSGSPGTADALTIRGWDQSTGTSGTFVSVASTGGTSAFSSTTDVVSLTINANNTPVVDLNGVSNGIDRIGSFTEGSAAVAFTSGGTNFSDLNNSNVASLKLAFDVANFSNGSDEKLIIAGTTYDLTTAFGNAASGTVSVSGTTYDWSSSVSGGTTTLSFTGPSGAALTTPQVEALIDAFKYQNSSTDPTSGSGRVFSLSAVDANGSDGTSAIAKFTISVSGVNNPPTVDTAIPDQTISEGLPFAFQFSASTFKDLDGETLTYSAKLSNGNPLPGWLQFNAIERRFYGAPPKDSPNVSIDVIATDGSGASATDSFTFNTVAYNVNAPDPANPSVAYIKLTTAFQLVNSATFSSSGYYEEETNSFQTASTPLAGSNFVFYQDGTVNFNGNNVPGYLSYNDTNGNVVTIFGVATRPIKTPTNQYEGIYLWIDGPNANSSSDNQAYVLSFSNYFNGNQVYNSSSDRVDATLNSFLDQPALAISSATINEGGQLEFTVTRSGDLTKSSTVNYNTALLAGNTASASDFTAISGTLSFANGESSKTIVVNTTNDSYFELSETLTVELSNASGARIDVGTAIGTITDNDPTPAFSVSDAGNLEGSKITFTVTRSGNTLLTQTVNWSTAFDDTGANPADAADFTGASGVLTFAAGETSKTIVIDTINDVVQEQKFETFKLLLSEPTNGATIADGTGIGVIQDDEGTSYYSVANVTRNEADGTITFTVSRSQLVGEVQTLNYNFTTKSATVGATNGTGVDVFGTLSGTLTFATNELSKTVTLNINNDAIFESSEEFYITLSNLSALLNSGAIATEFSAYNGDGTLSSGVSLQGGFPTGSASSTYAIGTILDDDAASYTVTGGSVTEGGNIVFTITLNKASSSSQSIDYSTAILGSDNATAPDFTASQGTLTFAPGETSKTVTIGTIDDTLNEIDETFTLQLSNAVGGATIATGSATGTILDNDKPTLSISSPTTVEGSISPNNYNYAYFNVTLDSPGTADISFGLNLANGTGTAGTDASNIQIWNGSSWVAYSSGSITILAGNVLQKVRVRVANDGIADNNETVLLQATSITNAANTTATGTLTILDTSVSLGITGGQEGPASSYLVTATLAQPSIGQTVITLSNGQTITIANGETEGTWSTAANNGEDPYVDASSLSIYTSSAVVTSPEGDVYSIPMLNGSGNPVVGNITDTINTTTVTLDGDIVDEGTSATVTASVDNAVTGSDLVLTLSNGEIITIAVGQTSGSVTFDVQGDDPYIDDDTLSLSIDSFDGGNFEDLDTSDTADVTVNDTIDTTTVTLDGDIVDEGTSATVTASVDNAVTGSDLVLTLSNGEIITIAVGQTSGSVTFDVQGDDPYIDDDTLSLSIDSFDGGNFEDLDTSDTADVTVNDTIDTTTVTLDGDIVDEGTSATVTASVDNAVTGSDLVLTLSNGEIITIAVGQTSGSVTFDVQGDDPYIDDDTLSLSIDSFDGGNFEDLDTSDTADVTVNDTIDTTTVTLDGDIVDEGTSATVTASVDNAVTGSDLVLTLSNGEIITIAVGQTSGSVTFDVQGDDPYIDDDTLSLSIDSFDGGNFEDLDTSDTADVTVNDTIDTTTVTLDGDIVDEGTSATVTASVDNAVTGSDLVLTLSNGEIITIAVGQTSGSVTFDVQGDDPYIDDDTLSLSIDSFDGGNFEDLDTSDTADVTVNDTIDTTTVTLDGDIVDEGTSATVTASVDNAVTGSDLVLTLSNGEIITIAVGQTSGSVTFDVQGDDPYIDDDTLSLSIDSFDGGNFEDLDTSDTADVTVNDTIDTTTVTLDGDIVDEGTSATVTASVDNAVTGSDLVLTLSNGEIITIAVGQTSGSVTFDVQGDDPYIDDDTLSLSIDSFDGGNFEDLDTSDTADVTVNDTIDTTTVTLDGDIVDEGTSATVTASVDNAVTGSDLVLTLSNGEIITIAVGQTSGSVTFDVQGDDPYIDDDTLSLSIDSFDGGNFEDLDTSDTADVTVNDTIDTTTVTLDGDIVDEGTSATVTASVDNAVTGSDLVLTLSNGEIITIAVGQTSGSVTFDVQGDDPYIDDDTLSLSIDSFDGGNFEDLDTSDTADVTVNDTIDTTTVTLDGDIVDEGTSATVTASVDNAVTGSDLVLTLSNGEIITIAVGQTSGSVTFDVQGDDPYIDDDTLSLSIDSFDGGNFEDLDTSDTADVTVNDTIDTTTVTLDGDIVDEGTSATVTASVDNAVTGSDLVLTLSNGEIITIAVGQTSGSVTFDVQGDDPYIDDDTLSLSIDSFDGGNFEDLDTSDTADVTVNDTIDTTTVTLDGDIVDEGTSATVTASVDNAVTGSDLVLTLSNGEIITIAVGQTSGSVTFDVQGDDPYIDDDTLSLSIDSFDGGNFEDLDTSDTADVTVNDTIDTTTVTLDGDIVDEGTSATVTASVDNAVTGSDLVLTLSNGEIITIAVGQTSGSVTFDVQGDDPYIDDDTLSLSIDSFDGGNFEDLDTSDTADVTVNDTIDTTTVTLDGDIVDEGTSATVTASVDNAVTGSDLVLTLSNGEIITIAVGQTSGSVTFDVQGDDPYIDDDTLSLSIDSFDGGNFEDLDTSDTADVTVNDTIDTTTVTLDGDIVDEGTSATVTASVDNAVTGSDLVLTLSNGEIITIAVGQTSGSVTFDVQGDDPYIDDDTLSLSIDSFDGGNFEDLDTSDTADVTVNDTIDTTTVTLDGDIVDEGTSATVTASVDNAVTGSDLVLTLSNGEIITIAVGQTSGSVTFDVQGDDPYIDDDTLSLSIDSFDGGNFEDLDTSDTADVTVNDTIDTTTVTLDGDIVDEGTSATVTASVDNAVTGSDLVLTLSNGEIITIAVGQTSGSVTFDVQGDDPYIDDDTLSLSIDSFDGGNFEDLDTSDTADVTVNDTIDTTTVTLDDVTVNEDGTITYTASVDHPPQGAFSVTLNNGVVISFADGSLTGSSDPQSPQGEDVYLDSDSFTVSIDSTSGGNFENLDTSSTATITIDDTIDTTTVTVTTADVTEDDASVTFNFALSNKPATGIPASLTVDIGGTAYTINLDADGKGSKTISTKDSDVYIDASSLTATVTAINGGNFEATSVTDASATAQITDTIDTTTLTLSGSSVSEDDGVLTIEAELSNSAAEEITITLDDGNGHVVSITIPKDGTTGSAEWQATAEEFNYLAVGEEATLNFTVSVSTNSFENLVFPSTCTVAVTGENDGVNVEPDATDASGAVVEDTNVTNNQLSDSFAIAFRDLDLSDSHTVSWVADPANTLGGVLSVGSITEAADTTDGSVALTYTVNNSAVQYLASGQTTTESFTVTISDGHDESIEQVVEITITGVNDAPDISVQAGDDASAALTEAVAAAGIASAGLKTTGTLSVRDIDTTDKVDVTIDSVTFGGTGNGFKPASLDAAAAKAMLSLSQGANQNEAEFDALGNLTWAFDSGLNGFDYLASGETQLLTYLLKATDTAQATDSQTVVITITGTQDIAVISGVSSGTVTEKGGSNNDSYAELLNGIPGLVEPPTGNYSRITGKLDVVDLDHDQAFFTARTETTSYGTFQVGTDGNWSYQLNDNSSAVELLGKNDRKTESFLVTSKDGSASQNVVITINGADDAARIQVNDQPTTTVSTRYSNRINRLEFSAVDPDGPASAISSSWKFQQWNGSQWITTGTVANTSPSEVIVSLDAGTYGAPKNLRFAPSTINGNRLTYTLMGTADLAAGQYRIVGDFTDGDNLITTSSAVINITQEDLALKWKGSTWVGAPVKAMNDPVTNATVYLASQFNETDLTPGGLTVLAQRIISSQASGFGGWQAGTDPKDFYVNFWDRSTNTLIASTLAAGTYTIGGRTFTVPSTGVQRIKLAYTGNGDGNGKVTAYVDTWTQSLSGTETSKTWTIGTEIGGQYYQHFSSLDDTVVCLSKTALSMVGATGNIQLADGANGASVTIGSGASAKTLTAATAKTLDVNDAQRAVSFSAAMDVTSNKTGTNLQGKLNLSVNTYYDLVTGVLTNNLHQYQFTSNSWTSFGMSQVDEDSNRVIDYQSGTLIGKASGVDKLSGQTLGGNLNIQINVRDNDVGTDTATGTWSSGGINYQGRDGSSAVNNRLDMVSVAIIDGTKGNSLFNTNGLWSIEAAPLIINSTEPNFNYANIAM